MDKVFEYSQFDNYGIAKIIDPQEATIGFFNTIDEILEHIPDNNIEKMYLNYSFILFYSDKTLESWSSMINKEFEKDSHVNISNFIFKLLPELCSEKLPAGYIGNLYEAITYHLNDSMPEYNFKLSWDVSYILTRTKRRNKNNKNVIALADMRNMVGQFVELVIKETNPIISSFVKSPKITSTNGKPLVDILNEYTNNGIVEKEKYPNLYKLLEDLVLDKPLYISKVEKGKLIDVSGYINGELKKDHLKLMETDLHYTELFVIFMLQEVPYRHGIVDMFYECSFDEILKSVKGIFDKWSKS